MIGQFLLTFREVLEAALVTSIVLAYLVRTNRRHLTKYVWLGVSIAAAASLVLGTVIWFTYGLLNEPIQVLFEGSAAILAVVVLTSMILWLANKGKEIRKEVEARIESIATKEAAFAIGSFSFLIAFREGLETVLFLTPFLSSDPQGTIVGALIGVAASVVLSYGIFVFGMGIDLRRFFYFTSVLLVLLAGGLAGYGTHELIEYAEFMRLDMGWFGERAYSLNIPSSSPLHHNGLLGSILAVMFGYTVSAEWGRLLVHFAYLMLVIPFVVKAYRRR
jgi:high-affinity iron transporter